MKRIAPSRWSAAQWSRASVLIGRTLILIGLALAIFVLLSVNFLFRMGGPAHP
jgi:hypothetical protein